MRNLAKVKETIHPCMEYGRVIGVEDRSSIVHTSSGPIRAEQAVGCLVKPEPGDTVLLAVAGSGQDYILSVLEREDGNDAATDIEFQGKVNLRVNGGALSMSSDEEITWASPRISMHANRAEAVFEKFSFVGRVFKGQVKRIHIVAKAVENTYRRLTQRLRDSIRYVEDHEEIQSGSTRYLVEDTLTMQAKNADHLAEEIVRINAEQVHLG